MHGTVRDNTRWGETLQNVTWKLSITTYQMRRIKELVKLDTASPHCTALYCTALNSSYLIEVAAYTCSAFLVVIIFILLSISPYAWFLTTNPRLLVRLPIYCSLLWLVLVRVCHDFMSFLSLICFFIWCSHTISCVWVLHFHTSICT